MWFCRPRTPPKAAARRADLEESREKSPNSLNSTSTTERNAGHALFPPALWTGSRAGLDRIGIWDELVGRGTVGSATPSRLTGEAQVRMGRLLGAVLAISTMLGGLLLVTAGPATACTCAQMTEAQLAARVDVLFAGTLVGSRVDPSVLTPEYRQREEQRIKELKERLGQSAMVGELDPVVLTFEVSRVYKGAVGKRQEIVIPPAATGGAGGTCGFYVPATPGPWLLFASPQSSGDSTLQLAPGQYLSSFGSLCLGSRALADGGEPGRGGPPARALRGPLSSSSPTRGGPPAAAPSGPDSSPSPTGLVVGVGVLAAGVAAGLGLAILRARRRASAN